MKIVIMGAAGFIGTNLAISLLKCKDNCISELVLVDEKSEFFDLNPVISDSRSRIVVTQFGKDTDFVGILDSADIVYHLISTTNPTNSNQHIADEITENIEVSVNLLEACKEQKVKRVIFVSSGGTIYGEAKCPIPEDAAENPVNTYAIQKITIEKLLYLYHYLYGLDYRIARFSNPYGPYQRPNGKLGAVTTFVHRALKGETVCVYGDGSVIRDYIYIDDAIGALINISFNDCLYKTYNVGSGKGVDLNHIIKRIGDVLQICPKVQYNESRKTDLKKNYLDVNRYESEFGNISHIDLDEGIVRTAEYITTLITNDE